MTAHLSWISYHSLDTILHPLSQSLKWWNAILCIGVNKEDLDISFNDGLMTITAERKEVMESNSVFHKVWYECICKWGYYYSYICYFVNALWEYVNDHYVSIRCKWEIIKITTVWSWVSYHLIYASRSQLYHACTLGSQGREKLRQGATKYSPPEERGCWARPSVHERRRVDDLVP